jgi:hypothetical protein
MASKKKLLVLTGAGASVDFGMPNVAQVSKILSDATRDKFPLQFDQSRGLFDYFESELAEHWRLRGRLSPPERPTFEDVLLAIFETVGAMGNYGPASPSTAFLSVRPFPIFLALMDHRSMSLIRISLDILAQSWSMHFLTNFGSDA